MSKKTAFPVVYDKVWDEGMDLRDYFAAKAMQVILKDKSLNRNNNADVWDISKEKKDAAKESYEVADAMLKAREQ